MSATNHIRNAARRGKALPKRMRGRMMPCAHCAEEFYIRPSEERLDKRYCSSNCYEANRHKHTNKGFKMSAEARATIAEKARRPKPWLRKDRTRQCLRCKRVFQHRPGKDGRERQRFCSTKCWYEYVRLNPWESGPYIDGWSRFMGRGPNWKRQRQLTLRRDGFACQRCGNAGATALLHVHHVVAFHAFGDDYKSANALENLTTLCNSCHPVVEFLGLTNDRRSRSRFLITHESV